MEREVSRRQFIRDGMAFSLAAPSLLSNLFPRDHSKIILDIAGYNIPLQIRSDREETALREFRMLRGESAVVINPSLNMVNEFKRMDKRLIVRPYFEHNNYDPKVLKKFLDYPPGIIWLPFVEPNIVEDLSIRDEQSGECQPKIVGKVVHDPEEIINDHLVPFAQAVLARPGGDQDVILIPATSQWASENEFDYPEVMYKEIRGSSIPWKNLGVAAHDYSRKYDWNESKKKHDLGKLTTLIKISTGNFGELLPFFITEAGPYQDEQSVFSEAEKAEEIGKTLATEIDEPILQKAVVTYNIWNQGYYRYAYPIMKDPNGCHHRVVNWFEKTAIFKEDGATESFHRIRSLVRRRDAELGRQIAA